MSTYDQLPSALIAFGLVLGGIMALEVLVVFTPPVNAPLGLGPTVATMVTSAPLMALLVAGGYWLKGSDLDPDRYPRVAIWVGAGLGVLVVFFGLIALLTRDSWLARLTMLRWAASTGAGAGLLAGLFEARALDRAVVTERARLQNVELRRRNERLEEFASILSHDLRNPLNVAEGYVEFAREEYDDEGLATATEALDRMNELIEATLTLARSGQLMDDPEPVALADLVERCWRNVPTDDATLEVHDDPTVVADSERLQHLFENLFRNAVEHGGPEVTVRMGALDDGFYVEDDGPGIPAEARGNVFDSGFSTSDDGTGFGLAIVRQIVDAHGWDVRVTDGADGGARFEVTWTDTDRVGVAGPSPT